MTAEFDSSVDSGFDSSVDSSARDSWRTKWGTLYIQGETVRHEGRAYYPEWHEDSRPFLLNGSRPTIPDFSGKRRSKKRLQKAVYEWLLSIDGLVDATRS